MLHLQACSITTDTCTDDTDNYTDDTDNCTVDTDTPQIVLCCKTCSEVGTSKRTLCFVLHSLEVVKITPLLAVQHMQA